MFLFLEIKKLEIQLFIFEFNRLTLGTIDIFQSLNQNPLKENSYINKAKQGLQHWANTITKEEFIKQYESLKNVSD